MDQPVRVLADLERQRLDAQPIPSSKIFFA
jgi:hypothetical protein